MTHPVQSRQVEVVNPFDGEGSWFTGGLHMHTSGSDGLLAPDEALSLARSLGYDFLALTDHETVTIPDSPPPGILHIPGVEYATRSTDPERFWHVVALGTEKCLAMPGYPVKAILKLVAEVAPFYFVAHPYWSNLDGSDLLDLPVFHAVEVYNHFAQVWLERGRAEFHWDHLLSAGRGVWGVATDDAHHADHVGGARVVVRAPVCDVSSILSALARGAFYSTTGPKFLDITVREDSLTVRTSPVRRIDFVADGAVGAVFDSGPRMTITEAGYTFRGQETYLRVQCSDESGNRAWTNPVLFWTTGANSCEGTQTK